MEKNMINCCHSWFTWELTQLWNFEWFSFHWWKKKKKKIVYKYMNWTTNNKNQVASFLMVKGDNKIPLETFVQALIRIPSVTVADRHQSTSSTSSNGSGTGLTALNFPALLRCSFSNLGHYHRCFRVSKKRKTWTVDRLKHTDKPRSL